MMRKHTQYLKEVNTSRGRDQKTIISQKFRKLQDG